MTGSRGSQPVPRLPRLGPEARGRKPTAYLMDESGVVRFLRRQPMAMPGLRSHVKPTPTSPTSGRNARR